MTESRSYYHCQHCREDISLEFTCPCCGLGKPQSYPASEGGNLFDDFFGWLRVHVSEKRMRYEAMAWEIDLGYIKACEVLEAELRSKIQEYKDGSDRIGGD